MKKLTPIILISLLCGFVLNTNAQNFIKIDASFYSKALDEVKNIDILLPADYYVNTVSIMQPYITCMEEEATRMKGIQGAYTYYSLHVAGYYHQFATSDFCLP